jgi:glycosyltransferase involved in cell wall biosynthesis
MSGPGETMPLPEALHVAEKNCTPQEAGDAPEISIVLPCLNEARTLEACIRRAQQGLAGLHMPGEIIVVDNGSTDASPAIASALGVRVVQEPLQGYGRALQAGLAAARGRYVILADADGSYDVADLALLIQRLRSGDDLVVGNRFQGGICPGAMPWLHRWFGNPLLSGILNWLFRTPIWDAHCGLRGIRKESYERLCLTSPGMEFASEMIVQAALQGQKMSEVPVVLYPDGREGPSHLRSFRDGWRHLRLLLTWGAGRWYGWLAALLSLSGLGLWLLEASNLISSDACRVGLWLAGALLVMNSAYLWWLKGAANELIIWKLGKQDVARGTLESSLLWGLGLELAGLGEILGWCTLAPPMELRDWLRCLGIGLTLCALGIPLLCGSFLRELQRQIARRVSSS